MPLDYTYEEITSEEANFIISLYEIISRLVREQRAVTLVGLAYELNIKTKTKTKDLERANEQLEFMLRQKLIS